MALILKRDSQQTLWWRKINKKEKTRQQSEFLELLLLHWGIPEKPRAAERGSISESETHLHRSLLLVPVRKPLTINSGAHCSWIKNTLMTPYVWFWLNSHRCLEVQVMFFLENIMKNDSQSLWGRAGSEPVPLYPKFNWGSCSKPGQLLLLIFDMINQQKPTDSPLEKWSG